MAISSRGMAREETFIFREAPNDRNKSTAGRRNDNGQVQQMESGNDSHV